MLEHIRLSDTGDAVVILDQSLLPSETRYLTLYKPDELFEAIKTLRVRGAPAIGIFAGYALYVLARSAAELEYPAFLEYITRRAEHLSSSRPTAVNLSRMARRMVALVKSRAALPVPQIIGLMRDEADRIRDEDIAMCKAISEHGLTLIRDGFGILTHCNAGPLATSKYGTGLGAIFLAYERGMKLRVFCDETRPLLQGARLTAYELLSAGIDCTLICDNMASIVMREGKIDACFVGCDRVARNGDTANKIGTSGVAILARHYGIPFYVFCPSSTIDHDCATGSDIEIEHRNPDEIKSLYFENPIAPDGVNCYNPAFDVTDAELITAIITERGICYPPYTESLRYFS